MAIKHLAPEDWGRYFDAFSRQRLRARQTDYAEIRVLSLEDGVQPQTAWLPLTGITYDRKDDLLEILVENLDHLVLHPAEIFVEETEEGMLTSLEVVRRDGIKEIIEVR